MKILIDIPNEIFEWAVNISPKLDEENRGLKTKDGGEYKNIKGCLGQWAVGQYLKRNNVYHDYKEPYISRQYGDTYDILVNGDDVWDVKCRSWEDEIEKYGNVLMGEHERECVKKCDYYMFCTPDRDFKHIWIIGGISHGDLWNKLEKLPAKSQKKMKYDTAGQIKTRHFLTINRIINHC